MHCLDSRASRRGGGFGPLGGQHRIGTGRHRSASHDPDGLTDGDRPGERVARHRVTDHDEREAVIRSRPLRALRGDRVPVHGGAVESRHVHAADDRAGQNAPCRRRQAQDLGPQLP
jgi:hypothetical protein